MQRWTTVVVLAWLVTVNGVAVAGAQALVPGGLTALPPVQIGPNLVSNPGFESVGGSTPTSWTAGAGWNADQITRRNGTWSYRFGGGSTSVTQAVSLRKGIYNLSGWIKTQGLGGSNSGVRLTLDFRPFANEWSPSGLYSGTQDWTFVEIKSIAVPADRTAFVKLEAFNGPAGTAWFDDVKIEEQLAAPVEVFMLYPNYRGMLFDDQSPTLRFDVTIRPPGNDFPRYTVRGRLADEATGVDVTAQSWPSTARFTATLDGSGLQPGRGYRAEFSLMDGATGAAVSTYPAYRVSRVSGSGRASMNVSFDDKNRVLVRGTPRFILGVYDSGLGYGTTDSFWENLLWSPTGNRRMDGLRINLYLNYWYGESDATSMRALMDNLQKRNVMWLQTGNCFADFPAGPEFPVNTDSAFVQSVGSHLGSFGYYTIDECIAAMQPGAFSQYTRLRALDPDSATFAALIGNNETHLWRDSADVLGTDPYPMFGPEPGGGYNHRDVADWTAIAREAVQDSRPFFTVLQFFKFGSAARWPTLQEMRNHATMAIVEGARGLLWWSIGNGAGALDTVCAGWCAEKTGYMNNLKTVVGEVADLEAVLLADDAPAALSGTSNGNIRTKVKLFGGKGYVFAYNATNATASATFTWNTEPGRVTVNSENRTVATSGRTLSDSFGPYQAHVYVVSRATIDTPFTPSLAASKTGNGSGTVLSTTPGIDCGNDCDQDYPQGTPVTLMARASGGSVFAGWGGACAFAGLGPTCSLTVSADVAVAASFRPAGFDFDDDGRADVAIHDVTTGGWWVGLASGAGFAVTPWGVRFGDRGQANEDVFVADFTGDRRADVAIYDRRTGGWWVGRSTGAGFAIEPWASHFGTRPDVEDVFVGDFTGDGRADVAIHDRVSGDWWVGRSTGAGFAIEPWASQFGTRGSDIEEIFVADVDGDGRMDVVIHDRQVGAWWVGRSTGSGLVLELWATGFGTRPSVERAYVADFTGDGRADVAIHDTSTGQWWVGRSTGRSFGLEAWAAQLGNRGDRAERVVVADFTGDGRADVAIHDRASGTWWVGRSTGNGFAVETWARQFGDRGDAVEEILFADFTGDGRTDVAIHDRVSGFWWVGRSTGDSFAIEAWASRFGDRGDLVEQVYGGLERYGVTPVTER